MGTMDGIIDTVSAVHDVTPLMFLLKTRGKMIMAGAPEKPLQLDAFSLILGRLVVEIYHFFFLFFGEGDYFLIKIKNLKRGRKHR